MKTILFLLIAIYGFAVPNPPNRPSKAPFISGDAFRAISDYCYDEVDKSLNPHSVKERSTIFVKTDYLADFFSNIHPLIQVNYILITHNSDDPTPGPFAHFLDEDKILAWFGQNYDGFAHPKMHPIPMGIANFCWKHGDADVIANIQKRHLSKKHLVHMQFNPQTFAKERVSVHQKFKGAPYCYSPSQSRFQKYLRTLSRAKFEIAPRGHALDTHRIWESLYVGTIPIVKSSSLDPLYENLPILIVEDWEEVGEEFLNQKYVEFQMGTFHREKMYMDYWVEQIHSIKAI
jgi:hypothetical protein